MARRDDTAVVKIGTSSITDDEGIIDRAMVAKLCDEVAALRASGRRVVVVTSGAIAPGQPQLGHRRPPPPPEHTIFYILNVAPTRMIIC